MASSSAASELQGLLKAQLAGTSGSEKEELLDLIHRALTATGLNHELQTLTADLTANDHLKPKTAKTEPSKTSPTKAEESSTSTVMEKHPTYYTKLKSFLNFLDRNLTSGLNLRGVTQYCIGDNWLELSKFEFKTTMQKDPVRVPTMTTYDWERLDQVCIRLSSGSGKNKDHVRRLIELFVNKTAEQEALRTATRAMKLLALQRLASMPTIPESKSSSTSPDTNGKDKMEKNDVEKVVETPKVDFPSEEKLRETVIKVVQDSDVIKVAIMNVIDKVFQEYPGVDLESKRNFIKEIIVEII